MENLSLRHRCYMFESKGIITYDPPKSPDPWSAIISVDEDLSAYYRCLFLNHFKVSLMRPNWKAHISLFRGQMEYRPEMEHYWKEMDGQEVNFVYTQDVFWNDTHVWVNTYLPEFFKLRDKMGLSKTHEDSGTWGHVTIGKFRKIGQMGEFINYTYPRPILYDK